MRIDARDRAMRLSQGNDNGGFGGGRSASAPAPAGDAVFEIAPCSSPIAPSSGRPAPDLERIEAEALAILEAVRGCAPGSEGDLVRLFLEQEATGHHDEATGTGPNDTIVSEMPLRFGRADMVVFHVNGTATVIEARDGTRGYNHAVTGIGQGSLYAVQLAARQGAVKRVSRALLWSSTGNIATDAAIGSACVSAGVIPIAWPSMRVLMANVSTVRRVMGSY